MMPHASFSPSRSVEIELIKQDVGFYFDIMLNLATRQSIGILIFGLIPYLSLFTVETYKYLQNVFPQYARFVSREHKEIITASRMRIKLFDDKEQRVDGIFELLKWIMEFNKEWHINGHKGFLAPLKRALQYDLGIFFYDSHIIGSTHVGFFNIGYDKKDLPLTSGDISNVLPSLSKSIGFALGNYLGQLCSIPEFIPNNIEPVFSYNINDERMKYKDEKANRYLSVVFNGDKTIDMNFSLLLFLATLNFMQYIFRNVVIGSPPTLFKLKFVTLYHLVSSLEKLKKYYYSIDLLSNNSKSHFQDILEEKELALLRSRKAFRNILVHYTIRGIPESSLNTSENLFGLIEYFFDGKTYAEIDKMLDEQIARISAILEEWINWTILPSQLSNW